MSQRHRQHLVTASSLGAWFGLLAIALHALAPLAAFTLYGGGPKPAPHAHEQAAHSHYHGGPAHTAEHAPPVPDLICVGDCPCCNLGDRALLPPSRLALVLPASSFAGGWRIPMSPAPSLFRSGPHFPPRAPPPST